MGTAYAVTTSTNNVYLFTRSGTYIASNPAGTGASGYDVATDASGVATLNDSAGNAQLTVTSMGNALFSLTVTSTAPVDLTYTPPPGVGNPQNGGLPGNIFAGPISGTVPWQSTWKQLFFSIVLAPGAVLTNIPKFPAGSALVPTNGVGGIRG